MSAKLIDVDAHEGPVYVPHEDALYFTTVPRPGPTVDIKRLALDSMTVSVVRPDAGAANGMALGPDGRLVVCEQRDGALSLVDRAGGARTLLVDGFNSPNDVVVKSDGTIWFTDPSYGWLQGFRPRPRLRDGVRRYDPRTGAVTTVADSLDKPNGLCFSPDESVLYVSDSGTPHHIKAFHVLADGRLTAERVHAEVAPGFPDGIKVDSEGRAGNPPLHREEQPMSNGLEPGLTFPDFTLPDDNGARHRLSTLQGDDVLVLHLSRGEHCPRERMHHRELLRFYEWCAVAFTQLVSILPNTLHDTYKMRIATGARWTFLADEELEVRGRLEIDEYTDTHHDNAVVPHTLILSPGLQIEKVYVGYWFWGRPSPEQLWVDLGELHARIKPDFDPTLPAPRAEWEARSVAAV